MQSIYPVSLLGRWMFCIFVYMSCSSDGSVIYLRIGGQRPLLSHAVATLRDFAGDVRSAHELVYHFNI